MSCSADTKVPGRSLRHDVVPHVAAHDTHQERLKISLVAPKRLFQQHRSNGEEFNGSKSSLLHRTIRTSAKRLDTSQKGDIGTFGWRQSTPHS
jgi:hypothetical protein